MRAEHGEKASMRMVSAAVFPVIPRRAKRDPRLFRSCKTAQGRVRLQMMSVGHPPNGPGLARAFQWSADDHGSTARCLMASREALGADAGDAVVANGRSR